MSSAKHDIETPQGASFTLFMSYQDTSGSSIDLATYDARMQVRRHITDSYKLLHLTGTTLSSSVTGGGSAGSYTGDVGYQMGTGGILLNSSSSGVAVTTGGIHLSVDSQSMANVPAGKHFYDIEIKDGPESDASTTVTRLIEGVFEVTPEVTR